MGALDGATRLGGCHFDSLQRLLCAETPDDYGKMVGGTG